jgi:hypothetical protein
MATVARRRFLDDSKGDAVDASSPPQRQNPRRRNHKPENPQSFSQNQKHTMAPPSQLAIATGSVQRLVKEESSYYKELTQQETRLAKLLASKDEDENAEFQLKQEVSQNSFTTHSILPNTFVSSVLRCLRCVPCAAKPLRGRLDTPHPAKPV